MNTGEAPRLNVREQGKEGSLFPLPTHDDEPLDFFPSNRRSAWTDGGGAEVMGWRIIQGGRKGFGRDLVTAASQKLLISRELLF
jgi:hypothetical protein